MNYFGRVLHLMSTLLLAIGFVGTAAFMVDVSTGWSGSGANIGLGLIATLCLGCGALGLLIGIAAAIFGIVQRARINRPR